MRTHERDGIRVRFPGRLRHGKVRFANHDRPFMHAPAEQVHVAEKIIDERRRGMIVNLLRRANLLDLPVAQNGHAVGHFQRLLLVVRHKQGRDVDFVVQFAQPAAQFLAHLRVERAERLVQQQNLRLDRERAGERDALSLPAGKLGRIPFGERLELDEFQQLVRRGRGFRPPAAASVLGRTRRPKAMFSKTLMCRNSA